MKKLQMGLLMGGLIIGGLSVGAKKAYSCDWDAIIACDNNCLARFQYDPPSLECCDQSCTDMNCGSGGGDDCGQENVWCS